MTCPRSHKWQTWSSRLDPSGFKVRPPFTVPRCFSFSCPLYRKTVWQRKGIASSTFLLFYVSSVLSRIIVRSITWKQPLSRWQPSHQGSDGGETGVGWRLDQAPGDVCFYPMSLWCYNPHNISLGKLLLFPSFRNVKWKDRALKCSGCLTLMSLMGLLVKLRSLYSDIMFYMMDFPVSTIWECLLQRFPKPEWNFLTLKAFKLFLKKRYGEIFLSCMCMF